MNQSTNYWSRDTWLLCFPQNCPCQWPQYFCFHSHNQLWRNEGQQTNHRQVISFSWPQSLPCTEGRVERRISPGFSSSETFIAWVTLPRLSQGITCLCWQSPCANVCDDNQCVLVSVCTRMCRHDAGWAEWRQERTKCQWGGRDGFIELKTQPSRWFMRILASL